MEPQTPQHDEKKGHEAAANLAFATSLSQMLQGQQPGQSPETPQEPQEAPEQTETPDASMEEPKDDLGAKISEMELSFSKKLDDIRREMKDEQRIEMDMLKQTIQEALTDEQD